MKALQKAVTILADIEEDDCAPKVYESIWECINLIEEADFNEENQRLRDALAYAIDRANQVKDITSDPLQPLVNLIDVAKKALGVEDESQ